MARRDNPMNLVLFLAPTGRGWTWRSSRSRTEELWGLSLPLEMTQAAERAKIDAIFIGNWLVQEGGRMGQQPFTAGYEPFTLMGALAGGTEKIGLIGTASTTFEYPYNTARFLSMLDWLSGGRVGWNVVTSAAGEQHFGMELPPHDERYSRAQEYVEVAYALWDAWDDDAVIDDRENAQWASPDGIHPIDYTGEYLRVQGQLFMNRSPQGWPVIVQAGQSPQGMEFASRNAEVVFTAQTDMDAAIAFRRELKERAAAVGRDPDGIKILPGLLPTMAETTEEAKALEAQFNAWTPLDVGLERVAGILQESDLDGLDPDEPIPPERLVSPDAADIEITFGSRYRNFYDMAVKEKMTLREIVARTDRNLGHYAPTGTVDEIADLMQEWYEAGACDGWSLAPAAMPEAFEPVVELLIPELQRRGLARTEYAGTTLRDHLGLKRPASPSRRAAAVSGARWR
jgi:FMN-dependent oxidoreductase (nitrilotriacetate monooxygenase family)